jgi:long-chain acyl-CoA synthetase
MSVNVATLLRDRALRAPDGTALLDASDASDAARPRSVSAGQLDAGARRCAGALGHAFSDHPTVTRGRPTVALLAESGPAYVSAFFGIAYAGGAAVPIPLRTPEPELTQRLALARCDALLCDAPRREVAEAAAGAAGGLPVLDLEAAVTDGAAPDTPPAATAPGETALILFTSGTGGAPKAAAISHAALVVHTAGLVHHTLGLGAGDRILGVLPVTHSYGLRMVVLASLYAGATAVLAPRFDAEGSLRLMRDHGITWVPAVPTMFAAWGSLKEAEAPPALKWCLSAGAPLADEIALRAETILGADVRQGYGLTEATFSTLDAPPHPRGLGTVGRPVFGVEVRLDDAGEIRLRGPNVMTGYLGDPGATAATIEDGWVHTGDLGRFDDDGRLIVVDRLKDLILRGGHSIAPAEVEAALVAHPAVTGAAVVGLPDPYYGEEIVAVVTLATGAARPEPAVLAEFVAGRLDPGKRPRAFAFVDALPQGPSGKIQRRDLKARLAAGDLALEPAGAPR